MSTQPPTSAATANPNLVDPSGLGALLGSTAPAAAPAGDTAPKPGQSLVDWLGKRLQALQDALDSGQASSADAQKSLHDLAQSLTAALAQLAARATPAAENATPQASGDSAATAVVASTTATVPVPLPAARKPLPSSLVELLAPRQAAAPDDTQLESSWVGPRMARSDATGGAAAATTGTATTTPIAADALQALATKLETMSQTLSAGNPKLAQELAILSQTFSSMAASGTDAIAALQQQLGTTDNQLGPAILKFTRVSSVSSAAPATDDAAPAAMPALSVASLLASRDSNGPTSRTSSRTSTAPADAITPKTTPAAAIATLAAATTRAAVDASDDGKPSASDSPALDVKPADPASTTATTAATATVTDAPAAKALPAAYQSAANPINMGQVAFEMVRQFQQGSSRFTIRLDPPELGRVDVKMHVDAAGAVTARLTVDRAETLDMFQRDRSSLEKALTQAGLDSGKTNLEFSLRQNPFAGTSGGNQQQPQPSTAGTRFSLTPSEDDISAVPAITLYRGIASTGGVNLFV